jgi:quercetin 2,3-dioxygenase
VATSPVPSDGVPGIDVRRAGERFHTRLPWLDSRHSFSFSRHYDPRNVGHGLLLVNNDDVVRAGTGFSTHPHQDMEIVTWVLSGELEHKDSVGNTGVIYPGLAQRMSAGTGIWHSEMNPSAGEDAHFVQMWVPPDTERIDPGYQQLDVNAELDRGGLVPIASGRGHDAAIAIRQRGAVLWGGRLAPGETVSVPDARLAHLFVAGGRVLIEGVGELVAGDAVRLTGAGSPVVQADGGPAGAEVLIWEMG